MAQAIKIISNIRKEAKYLRMLTRNVTAETYDDTRELLHQMEEAMIMKTAPFQFGSGKGISITDSFVIDTPRKSPEQQTLRLRNVAPHARAAEEGVQPHWLPTFSGAFGNFDSWLEHKGFDPFNSPAFLLLGGANSAMKKGDSDRQFFNITIDEFNQLGKFDKLLGKALDSAYKRTYKKGD